jgi:HPt (histidine-containing phosphotransfer) domain-containing protein
VPLLEHGQIASLRNLASEPEFLMLMQSVMDSVQRTVDEILAGAESAPMGAAAHRLKGTAGMGGLARISALAGSLEEACASGAEVRALQQQLADCLRDTQAALAVAAASASSA